MLKRKSIDVSKFQAAFEKLGERIEMGQGNLEQISTFLGDPQIAKLIGFFFDERAFSPAVQAPIHNWGVIPIAVVPIQYSSKAGVPSVADLSKVRVLEDYDPYPTAHDAQYTLGIHHGTDDKIRLALALSFSISEINREHERILEGMGLKEIGTARNIKWRKVFSLKTGHVGNIPPQVVIDGLATYLSWVADQGTIFGPGGERSEVAQTMQSAGEDLARRQNELEASRKPAVEHPTRRRLPGS